MLFGRIALPRAAGGAAPFGLLRAIEKPCHERVNLLRQAGFGESVAD